MKSRHHYLRRAYVTLLAGFALALAAAAPATAAYYPNAGDLWYDGYFYADSYLVWDNPGPWEGTRAYEHDLGVRSHYFEECSTWTDLPNSYDDCPTAGHSEGEYRVFSFGTYDADEVRPGHWYFGAWSLSGGYSFSSDFVLNGQEVWHDFCWWDWIWCMNGIRSERLLSGWFDWSYPYYDSWWK